MGQEWLWSELADNWLSGMGYFQFVFPGNQTWWTRKSPINKCLVGKVIHINGWFSSKPCLITGGCLATMEVNGSPPVPANRELTGKILAIGGWFHRWTRPKSLKNRNQSSPTQVNISTLQSLLGEHTLQGMSSTMLPSFPGAELFKPNHLPLGMWMRHYCHVANVHGKEN